MGFLFLRQQGDGRWVLLAGEPDVKVDNLHTDGRPHLHVGGWDSEERRDLRAGLTAAEAAQAIADQLESQGYLQVDALVEELS